jgi:hypothetical protein
VISMYVLGIGRVWTGLTFTVMEVELRLGNHSLDFWYEGFSDM